MGKYVFEAVVMPFLRNGMRPNKEGLMKKFALIVLCLLNYTCLQALPVGNPTEAALYTQGVWIKDSCPKNCWCTYDEFLSCLLNFSVRFGYYGDFVFNRNLAIQDRGLNQGKVIRETKMNTNAGYLVFNVWEIIDAFATMGTTNIRIRTDEISWVINGGADGVLFSDTNFSWSSGIKGVLFHWSCFDIGFEGQYFQANPHFKEYISSFVGATVSFDHNNDFTYREWQAAAVLSYNLFTTCPNFSIVPYIAGKWSHAQLTTHNFRFIAQPSGELFTIFDLKSHKSWGFAVGTTFALYNSAGFTVEGRFGDEIALYVNSQFCF